MNKKNQVRIKMKLLEKGIKQKELAKILEYSPAMVCMILSGKEYPTRKFKNWVKENLGVSVSG